MRIDASNLLLAAQAQKTASAKTQTPRPAFETLDFAKTSEGQDKRQTAQPGALPRPGMQLDIKV